MCLSSIPLQKKKKINIFLGSFFNFFFFNITILVYQIIKKYKNNLILKKISVCP